MPKVGTIIRGGSRVVVSASLLALGVFSSEKLLTFIREAILNSIEVIYAQS